MQGAVCAGVRTISHRTLLTLTILAVAVSLPCAGSSASHAYNLADFMGTVPFNHVSLFVDRPHGEVYVLDANCVHIFNAAGMEIYQYDIDPSFGSYISLTVEPTGDILGLGYAVDGSGAWTIQRFDYRGEPREALPIQGLPADYTDFRPSAVFLAKDSLFLVSKTQMLVAVMDRSGTFRKGWNLGSLIEIPEKERDITQISGLSVDDSGALLFTVPVQFRAYVVSPEGTVVSFGKSGSAPGQFGVLAGIVSDGHGHYLVADKLRSVVMAFDGTFRFLTEFGFLGLGPDNLVRPDQLAVGDGGKLYVTQLYNRGVAVYSLALD
jgi:hypothetical protein